MVNRLALVELDGDLALHGVALDNLPNVAAFA